VKINQEDNEIDETSIALCKNQRGQRSEWDALCCVERGEQSTKDARTVGVQSRNLGQLRRTQTSWCVEAENVIKTTASRSEMSFSAPKAHSEARCTTLIRGKCGEEETPPLDFFKVCKSQSQSRCTVTLGLNSPFIGFTARPCQAVLGWSQQGSSVGWALTAC